MIFSTAIALLMLSSCKKDVATSLKEPPARIESSSAENSVNAVPINYSETFPVSGSTWNSCTQEFIDFSGTGHVEVRGMISDSKITFVLHFNYPNVKGLGRTSGIKYISNSTFNYTNTFNFNTQFVYQQSASTRWIAQGSGLSFTIVNDWHLTVNANGDVTHFFTTGGDVIECH